MFLSEDFIFNPVCVFEDHCYIFEQEKIRIVASATIYKNMESALAFAKEIVERSRLRRVSDDVESEFNHCISTTCNVISTFNYGQAGRK